MFVVECKVQIVIQIIQNDVIMYGRKSKKKRKENTIKYEKTSWCNQKFPQFVRCFLII